MKNARARDWRARVGIGLSALLVPLASGVPPIAFGAGVAVSTSCDSAPQYGDVNVNTTVSAADGLDLKAVGELVKTVKNAEELERKLNESGGVNNLDLNADGTVDFIHVTEYGNDKAKGFSLTVQPAKGETQEIATIEIEKAQSKQANGRGEQRADVYVKGNEQVYGAHHHYHHSYPLGSMLLMAYLFRPHPFYVSPFGYGAFPPYYGMGHTVVNRTTYVNRTRSLTNGSNARAVQGRQSSAVSPNRGKTAKRGIRASLRSPTKSQRSFQSRSRRPTPSRGFAERVRSRGTSRRAAPNRKAAPQRQRSPRRSSFGRRSFSRRGMGSRGFRSRR